MLILAEGKSIVSTRVSHLAQAGTQAGRQAGRNVNPPFLLEGQV